MLFRPGPIFPLRDRLSQHMEVGEDGVTSKKGNDEVLQNGKSDLRCIYFAMRALGACESGTNSIRMFDLIGVHTPALQELVREHGPNQAA